MAFILLSYHEDLSLRLLRVCKAAQPQRILASLYFLKHLEVQKRKYESFRIQDHEEHILPQLYISDYRIKLNFGAIFAFEIVPYDYLMARCGKH